MNTGYHSLRSLVDKWLAPTAATPARVACSGRISSNHRRYVCVETTRPGGMLAIYFFRHDDGWCVFPPNEIRPALGGRVPASAG